jgi:VanZ family protein
MARTSQPPPRPGEGEIQQSATRRGVELLWSWVPVLVWMGVILALSSRSDLRSSAPTPVMESQSVFFAISKVAHVVEYSVLGLLLLRALAGRAGGLCLPLGAAVVVAVLASGLFGALDELRQSFVPNRTPRLADIALDTGSALAATLLAAGVSRLRQARPASRSGSVERARS